MRVSINLVAWWLLESSQDKHRTNRCGWVRMRQVVAMHASEWRLGIPARSKVAVHLTPVPSAKPCCLAPPLMRKTWHEFCYWLGNNYAY